MALSIKNFFNNIFNNLENQQIPFQNFVFTFFFVITLRSFIEPFSDNNSRQFMAYLHFYLSYIFLAGAIIIILHIFSNKPLESLSKLVMTGFSILISVPIIDLILSGGKGYDISYIMPEAHNDLLTRYLIFFGDCSIQGATPGIKTEIAIVLITVFYYIFENTQNIFKSLAASVIIYTAIFCWGASPFFIKWILAIFGIEYAYSDPLMIKYYILLILLILPYFAWHFSSKVFMTILKDLRLLRVVHFQLMFFWGVIIGSKLSNLNVNVATAFDYILLPISLIFSIIFAIITNNIEDYDIDVISNTSRPLITKSITLELYNNLSYLFLALALICSSCINFWSFFTILLFSGNYYIYSMPPLKLKRIPIFSKLLISLNSLALIMLGFSFKCKDFNNFPKIIYVFLLIGFTLAINFIDIKDYEGDKKAGIKTLPVLIGLKNSKFLIGIFFLICYLFFLPFILNNILILMIMFFIGTTIFFLINTKNYHEKNVFILYLISLLIILADTYFSEILF